MDTSNLSLSIRLSLVSYDLITSLENHDSLFIEFLGLSRRIPGKIEKRCLLFRIIYIGSREI